MRFVLYLDIHFCSFSNFALRCILNKKWQQLLVLETNLLLSGLGLHDQHQDMRLDIDNMSYEVLLALTNLESKDNKGEEPESFLQTSLLFHSTQRLHIHGGTTLFI